MYQHQDIGGIIDHLNPFLSIIRIDTKYDDDAYSGELQYLFRSKYIKIVIGAGYFRHRFDEIILSSYSIFLPPTPRFLSMTFNGDIDHTNLYLYSYINFPKNVTFTAWGKWRLLQTLLIR